MNHAILRTGIISKDDIDRGVYYFALADNGIKIKNHPTFSAHYSPDVSTFAEAEPLPIYFNYSKGEFIEYRDSSRVRDSGAFLETHEFATLVGSVTKYKGELYWVLAQPSTVSGNFAIADGTSYKSTIRTLADYIPEILDHPNIIKRRARAELMHKINPSESLSDLEKQVDLLTEIVYALVKKIPAEERPMYSTKLAEIRTVSSINMKPIDELVSDIISCKQNIRTNLKEYYKVKT